jgi:hypothetical protein
MAGIVLIALKKLACFCLFLIHVSIRREYVSLWMFSMTATISPCIQLTTLKQALAQHTPFCALRAHAPKSFDICKTSIVIASVRMPLILPSLNVSVTLLFKSPHPLSKQYDE